MSKKKKKKDDSHQKRLQMLVLITAITNLIHAVVNLILEFIK